MFNVRNFYTFMWINTCKTDWLRKLLLVLSLLSEFFPVPRCRLHVNYCKVNFFHCPYSHFAEMYGLEDGGIPATFFVHYIIGWKPHDSQVSLTWTFDGILSVWLQVKEQPYSNNNNNNGSVNRSTMWLFPVKVHQLQLEVNQIKLFTNYAIYN